MKKVTVYILLLIHLCVFAVAESFDSIIPDSSIWGLSTDSLKETHKADYEATQVGEDVALRVSNVEICSYDMDVYYVFAGKTNGGLYKIAYILNTNDFDEISELDECFQKLSEEVKRIEGDPDSIKKGTIVWNTKQYKIELGKGKLSKYTGLDQATVGMIFKKIDTVKPTKAPAPKETPKKKQENKETSGKYKGATVKVQIRGKTVEVHKSFKDIMDEYEAFFGRYIEFLKNPDWLKYSEMMLEYTETLQALEEIDNDELSSGDMAYYIEVYARIMNNISTIE